MEQKKKERKTLFTAREERLAAVMRENLCKRKAQQQARNAGLRREAEKEI